MKLLQSLNPKHLLNKIFTYFRRKRQARQKAQCTAISAVLEHPNLDVCSICTNEFCICKQHSNIKL